MAPGGSGLCRAVGPGQSWGRLTAFIAACGWAELLTQRQNSSQERGKVCGCVP